MTKRYTSEHIEFLKSGYASMNIRELTKAFNEKFATSKAETAIKATLNNHKIRCGRKGSDRLQERYRLFSEEQESFLRREYKNHSLTDLTTVFNEHFSILMTRGQVRSYTRNHKIRSGRTGQYSKGVTPWNTGTKGVMKANSGTFQKGNIPPNRKPLGSERICPKDGFVLIKVAEKSPWTGFPTHYKHKQRHVWEQNYGPVPEGMVVAFKDADKINCEPENLMLISRAELLTLNRNGYREKIGRAHV